MGRDSGNPLGDSIDGSEINIPNQAQGDVLYRSNTEWVRLPHGTAGQVLKINDAGTVPEYGAGGGLTLVTDVDTSAGDATSYTISSLDLDTDGYYLIKFQIDIAATCTIDFVINNDTTDANYNAQFVRGQSTTASAFINNTSQFGDSNDNGDSYNGQILISRGALGFPTLEGNAAEIGSGNAVQTHDVITLVHETAANVTRIDIIASAASGIGVNSKISLYKIGRA